MVKIRCQGCGRIVEVDKDWDKEATCDECVGNFAELNSKEDTYEDSKEEDEEEEESDEDYKTHCMVCGNESSKEFIYFTDCYDSDDLTICKKCIDKAYPRQTEVKEVVKFIENNPLKTSKFNPEEKNKFD